MRGGNVRMESFDFENCATLCGDYYVLSGIESFKYLYIIHKPKGPKYKYTAKYVEKSL